MRFPVEWNYNIQTDLEKKHNRNDRFWIQSVASKAAPRGHILKWVPVGEKQGVRYGLSSFSLHSGLIKPRKMSVDGEANLRLNRAFPRGYVEMVQQ